MRGIEKIRHRILICDVIDSTLELDLLTAATRVEKNAMDRIVRKKYSGSYEEAASIKIN